MEWKAEPTDDGWYWVQAKTWKRPRMVRVLFMLDGAFGLEGGHFPAIYFFEDKRKFRFYGPLEEPPSPQ